MEQYLLEMRHIKKSFNGSPALQDASLRLQRGEVHALLGENGAGKSTLMKILGGIYAPDNGEIFIDGEKVIIDSVESAQKKGISIIHQELALVPDMSVAENIYLGREIVTRGIVNIGAMNKNTQDMLDSFELDILSVEKISALTIAQQQMVEIIKSIFFNAKILVMDEPTSSLSEKDTEFLFATIKKLQQKNTGIIYISHRMSELYKIASRVTVMRDGEYIGEKEIARVSNDELIAMMVGRRIDNYYTRTFTNSGQTVLEVINAGDGKRFRNVSFCLKKGEILGFAGLVGSGRSEIMKCLFGIDTLSEGTVKLYGNKVSIKTPDDAIQAGIALVPESRKTEALFPARDVKFNITIEALGEFISGIFVNKKKETDITQKYIDAMRIKTSGYKQLISTLSGGNQQKAIVGRWLATNPRILILDEPTRGVDVAAKAELYAIMNELAIQGLSIIMISSELPEVLNMSDRVAVMCEGNLAAILSREGLTQETVMRYATGQNLSAEGEAKNE